MCMFSSLVTERGCLQITNLKEKQKLTNFSPRSFLSPKPKPPVGTHMVVAYFCIPVPNYNIDFS